MRCPNPPRRLHKWGLYTNVDCACFTIVVIKFTSLTYTVRALLVIRVVGFLHKLSTIDDVTKYRGIPASRYLFRRYIIVGHTAHRYATPCPEKGAMIHLSLTLPDIDRFPKFFH